MTKEQTEFVHRAIEKSIEEARTYMPNATDDEIREWVYHIGVYQSFSYELKMALAKEAFKPWNLPGTVLWLIWMLIKIVRKVTWHRTP